MEQTDYEKYQSFNPLISFLHSIRYKQLIKLFESLDNSQPIKVVDIGCAHAKTFELLNHRFKINYVGIELDEEFATVAHRRYGALDNFRIINASIEHHYPELENADVILSLETLEHIPERLVVRIIEQVALAKPKFFMCSVPNEVGPILLVKNIGSFLTGYIRHKEYKWKETFFAAFYNLDKVETHGTGHKGFDWRWLAQTLRHNLAIKKTYSNPISWFPRTFSFSVIFVCQPKI